MQSLLVAYFAHTHRGICRLFRAW